MIGLARHQLILNNAKVFYWEKYSKKKNTILLIHGLGGDYRGFLDLVNYLSDFHLILLDLPGLSESDPLSGGHNIAQLAKFLDSFTTQLDLNDIYLVGHSFGCSVVLMFAKLTNKKIKSIYLLQPVIENPHTISLHLSNWYFNAAIIMPRPIARFLLCSKVAVYLQDIALFTKRGHLHHKEILKQDYENYARLNLRALKESVQNLNTLRMNDYVSKQNQKIYALFGKQDHLLDRNYWKRFKDNFPNSNVNLISGGHLMMQEEPDVVVKYLLSYLT